MSWLFNSFQSDDPDSPQLYAPPSPNHSPRSVIGRQLRGVADFLAPPPSSAAKTASPADSAAGGSPDSVSSQTLIGIRNDLAEFGGSFKTGLSLLSSNKAVTGISRFASSLLQFRDGDDDDDDRRERVLGTDGGGGVPGINSEVLDFVKEISVVPACWTDFPLALENDFNMSVTQREHALAIEHLVPSLGTVREELHSYISDAQFWMIYFILLLSRLNKHDLELLSTPEIAEARNALLQKLQNRSCGNLEVDNSVKPKVLDTYEDASEAQRKKSPSRVKVVASKVASAANGIHTGDATCQWLEETDDTNASVTAQRTLEDEEGASFSDLEDDFSDLSSRLSSLGPIQEKGASSPSGSNDWVQLNVASRGQQKARQSISRESESDGSNGWLTVDDFD